uniref:Uncharacterized protein n=1 Tax=Populus trichocarpa TaxID=3694 RepID=A0A3N7EN98_POPTR
MSLSNHNSQRQNFHKLYLSQPLHFEEISKGMSFLGKISWMQCFVSLDRCRGKGKFLSKYHANEVTENEFSLLKCLNVSRF